MVKKTLSQWTKQQKGMAETSECSSIDIYWNLPHRPQLLESSPQSILQISVLSQFWPFGVAAVARLCSWARKGWSWRVVIGFFLTSDLCKRTATTGSTLWGHGICQAILGCVHLSDLVNDPRGPLELQTGFCDLFIRWKQRKQTDRHSTFSCRKLHSFSSDRNMQFVFELCDGRRTLNATRMNMLVFDPLGFPRLFHLFHQLMKDPGAKTAMVKLWSFISSWDNGYPTLWKFLVRFGVWNSITSKSGESVNHEWLPRAMKWSPFGLFQSVRSTCRSRCDSIGRAVSGKSGRRNWTKPLCPGRSARSARSGRRAKARALVGAQLEFGAFLPQTNSNYWQICSVFLNPVR